MIWLAIGIAITIIAQKIYEALKGEDPEHILRAEFIRRTKRLCPDIDDRELICLLPYRHILMQKTDEEYETWVIYTLEQEEWL